MDSVPSSTIAEIKNSIFPEVVANVGVTVLLRSKPVMNKVRKAHTAAYVHAHVYRNLCNAYVAIVLYEINL